MSKSINLLGTIIGFTINAANVQSMLFMKKGDLFMDYIKANKQMDTASYPTLRACVEKDLTGLAKEFDPSGKTLPWGKMSIKMKSHSLAVSMYKTWQRRVIEFPKDAVSVTAEMFSKFDKKSNKELVAERTVSKKSVYKEYDRSAALAFLNTYLVK